MALYAMSDMLAHAEANKYAVGYFEAFNMDAMLAVLDAAEATESPVIIGFGGQFLSSGKRAVKENVYHYGTLAREAAIRSPVPCAVLLNEADVEGMVYQGMNAGFNAVMYQKANEPFEETLKITKEICRVAHFLGIDVESEVGELPDSNIETGTLTNGRNTDVAEAKRFVRETNIDALALSIGNVHLLEGGKKAEVDFDLLRKLRKEIDIPLVLHGGTGMDKDALRETIRLGISKVNIGTILKRTYINEIEQFVESKDLSKIDPHVTIGWGGDDDMLSCGRAAIAAKVAEYIGIFGSEGAARKMR